jgi:hypothetical protein
VLLIRPDKVARIKLQNRGGPAVSQREDLIRPEAIFSKDEQKETYMQRIIPKRCASDIYDNC